MAARTTTPLLTTTLTIAAAAAAILVGCTQHTAGEAGVTRPSIQSATQKDGAPTSRSAPGSLQ